MKKEVKIQIIPIIIIIILGLILWLTIKSKQNILDDVNNSTIELKTAYNERIDSINKVIKYKDDTIVDLKQKIEVVSAKKQKVRVKYVKVKEENEKKDTVTYEEKSFELWLCEAYVDELETDTKLKDTLITKLDSKIALLENNYKLSNESVEELISKLDSKNSEIADIKRKGRYRIIASAVGGFVLAVVLL